MLENSPVVITDNEKLALNSQVENVAKILITLPMDSDEFKHAVASLNAMGNKEIVASASVSSALLDEKTNKLNKFKDGSQVSQQLLALREVVDKLSPDNKGNAFKVPAKMLAKVPFVGGKMQNYFKGFETSQEHLNAIITGLYQSRDSLRRDNEAVVKEQTNMLQLMKTLEQYAYLASQVKDAVESQIGAIEQTDPERARLLKEDVLFYALQKQQDIATQEAVNLQGYTALDLIKRNNAELEKGIQRATTTTVSALRTAVIVAQAVARQKIVINAIDDLNSTTNKLIASNARMLKQNVTKVYEQATSSTVDIDTLKTAFNDVMQAMDDVSKFKATALTTMEQNVQALSGEVERTKQYLSNEEERKALAAGGVPFNKQTMLLVATDANNSVIPTKAVETVQLLS